MTLTKSILKLKSNLLFYPIVKILKVLLWIKSWRVRYYKKLFSNIVSGSMVVEIKGIPYPIEMDVRSDILQRVLLTKEYEYDTVEIIRANIPKDKDAINVGANVGIFSVLMASLVKNHCNILAIEPTYSAIKYLINNRGRADYSKIIPQRSLCTDKREIYDIYIIDGKEEYSSIYPNGGEVSSASSETVDNLVKYWYLDPGLILIDTEGSELLVLKGAIETLKKYHPIIIMEVTNDNSATEYLLNLGYAIHGKADNNILFK